MLAAAACIFFFYSHKFHAVWAIGARYTECCSSRHLQPIIYRLVGRKGGKNQGDRILIDLRGYILFLLKYHLTNLLDALEYSFFSLFIIFISSIFNFKRQMIIERFNFF